MFKDLVFNPAKQFVAPGTIQIFVLLLFAAAFLLLWRRSKAAWFGYWSIAWIVESLALIAGAASLAWPRALLEFAFALLVFLGARSAPAATFRGLWSPAKRLLIPVGVLLLV